MKSIIKFEIFIVNLTYFNMIFNSITEKQFYKTACFCLLITW